MEPMAHRQPDHAGRAARSIPKIAKRMVDVTGRTARRRCVRPHVDDGGKRRRVDSYKRAKGLGIKVQQEWLATLDGRTLRATGS
ncbi:MAG: hypothetical protein ACLTXI_05600 [Collinsella sp.]